MSIDVQALYEKKFIQFGGAGSITRFPADFLRAVNNAQGEWAIQTDKGSAFDAVTATENTTIDIDEELQWAFETGVDYWLTLYGNFKAEGMELATLSDAWNRALAAARGKRDMDATAAADDGATMSLASSS